VDRKKNGPQRLCPNATALWVSFLAVRRKTTAGLVFNEMRFLPWLPAEKTDHSSEHQSARRRYNFYDRDKNQEIDPVWLQYSLAVRPFGDTARLSSGLCGRFQNGNKNAPTKPGGLYTS
jgi:hypothetical protein